MKKPTKTKIKNFTNIKKILLMNNYSLEAINEILKWYDCEKKKGVASC